MTDLKPLSPPYSPNPYKKKKTDPPPSNPPPPILTIYQSLAQVHSLHRMMAALLFFKTVSLLAEAARFHYYKARGVFVVCCFVCVCCTRHARGLGVMGCGVFTFFVVGCGVFACVESW